MSRIEDIFDNLTNEQAGMLIEGITLDEISKRRKKKIKEKVLKKMPKQAADIDPVTFDRKVLKKKRSFILACSAIAMVFLLGTIFYFNSFLFTNASENLMNGVVKQEVFGNDVNDEFVLATQDFSLELLRQAVATKSEKDINTLVSPLSVYLALGMAANGADNQTLEQFENVLGNNSGLSIDQLNKHYLTLQNQLVNDKTVKVQIANSIWYRNNEDFMPNQNFLQTNADYYGADAFKSDFDSQKAVKDINKWVKNNTDGLIDKIIEKIDGDTKMFIINSILFDAEWKSKYENAQVDSDTFYLSDNRAIDALFMTSIENSYLYCEKAQGFIKPYNGDAFSFTALLPNADVEVDELLDFLDADTFLSMLKTKTATPIKTKMPTIDFSYENELSSALKNMGLTNAFGNADFSRMSNRELFISDVLHKTHIKLDKKGTKAGAVTNIGMKNTAINPSEIKTLILNRPYVFAIIDNRTNLPLFLGIIQNPTQK